MSLLSKRLALVAAPSLLRQAGIYTASQLASRAVPFLLLPVLTRFLSPADYGVVAMFLLTVVVLEPFIGLGLPGAITVKYYDKSIDLPAYVGTGLRTIATVAVPSALLVWVLRDPLSQVTAVPPVWLVVVVPLVLARTVAGTVLALLRVREEPATFAVLQNLQTTGLLLLALLLVVGLGRGVEGRLEAEVLAWSAFALASVAVMWQRGWLRWAFVASYRRHAVAFGVPLIPHALGAVLILQTDRLLLTNLVGIEETGLYTVGYQLALVVELLAVSFNYAYTPWLFQKLAEPDALIRSRLVRLTYLQFAALALVALTAAMVMPRLGAVVLGERFVAAGQYVGWFAVGFLFSGMYYMVTNYIFFAEKTKWLAAVTISVAVVHIPLTFVMIKLNGGIGAAQAMATSLALSFVFTWIVSQRAYPMPWLGNSRRSDGAP